MAAVGVVLIAAPTVYAAEIKCAECHDKTVNSFSQNHHAKNWKGDPSKGCQSCHGSTDVHLKAQGGKETIISFTKGSKQTVDEQNKQCMSCHAKNIKLTLWKGSKHSKGDVSCSSCHKTHDTTAATKPTSETCMSCHKDIKSAVAKFSHHPIETGKVGCMDCHASHGSNSHGMIKADNVNQLCYKCHAEKRGPFVWEHAPVEENCSTCHETHGTSHANLLKEKIPNLCQDCHDYSRHPGTIYDASRGFKGSAPSAYMVSRSCNNCHSKIHGSNAPHNPFDSYNSGKYFIR